MDKDTAIQTFQRAGTSVPEFSLKGQEMWARVVSVYDGDTMTVILPMAGSVYKYSLRMNGIDTCEIKSKLEENKRKAIQARNTVLSWVMPTASIQATEAYAKKDIEEMLLKDIHLVYIRCDSFDKYGRLLADVYASPSDTTSFSDKLVELKLAYRYYGETKLTEQEQLSALM